MKKIKLLLLFVFSLSLHAQDDARAREDEMFGAPAKTPPQAPAERPSAIPDIKKAVTDAFSSGDMKDNPLQIGGTYYQRFNVSGQKGVSTADTPFSAPLQFDLFLDARPSDRVRGFISQRILYDSTRDAYSNPTDGSGSSLQFSSNSSAPTSLTGGAQSPNNPQTVLDQAWLKFDVERTVFVTVGKQHLKWGTSRFWNPTDFLNTAIRDPLLPYDLRLGNTMLKLDMPLESQRMNLYAVTLFDNPEGASTLGQLGQAFRLEKVIGSAEVGLDAVFRGGMKPAYGADISAPLGPFDVYAEGTYLTSATMPEVTMTGPITAGADISTLYTTRHRDGPIYQASGGINFTFGWQENRRATAGVEYFYNDQGYDNADAYPILALTGQFKPFYTGRNYAAFYLTAEGLDSGKKTSYGFSTLANLSDSSYISRLDFTWNFLTYLTFQAYYSQHYGRSGGEFAFAAETPALVSGTTPIPAVEIPQSLYDLGVSLRMAF